MVNGGGGSGELVGLVVNPSLSMFLAWTPVSFFAPTRFLAWARRDSSLVEKLQHSESKVKSRATEGDYRRAPGC